MRPDKLVLLRCLLLGFLVSLPFLICSLMEVVR